MSERLPLLKHFNEHITPTVIYLDTLNQQLLALEPALPHNLDRLKLLAAELVSCSWNLTNLLEIHLSNHDSPSNPRQTSTPEV